MSKILLRKQHLKVGTVFKTVNRFIPDRDWIICRIEQLDLEEDKAELSVLAWLSPHNVDYTRFHPVKGTKTMFTNISYRTKHNNTTFIDYYLPEGNLLYGTIK